MPRSDDNDGARDAGLWLSFVEGRFYFLMAVLVFLVVGFGYGRAFDAEWIHAKGAAPPIVRLHTLLAILWAALLVLQTGLAQAGRVGRHQLIGFGGLLLGGALTLAAAGSAVTEAQISLAHGNHAAVRSLLLPLESAAVYGLFLLLAAGWRHRTLTHRRLMLLAGFMLAGSGFSLFPPTIVPPGDFGVDVDLLVVICLGRDQIVRGRIHPVYLLSLPLLIALQVGTPMAVRSPLWSQIGAKMMQVSVPLSWGASDWSSPPQVLPPAPGPAAP